jgi:hypothetical protein
VCGRRFLQYRNLEDTGQLCRGCFEKRESADLPPLTWTLFQETLFLLAEDCIRRFASSHEDEEFYGFIFDCNADYGEILLCLNTEAELREWSERNYPTYSEDERDRLLRWNAGDWKYQGFNSTEPDIEKVWQQGWQHIEQQVQDAYLDQADDIDPEDDVTTTFMVSVCMVLIKLERANVFKYLSRTPGFRTLVSDHDESLGDAWERLNGVRDSFDELEKLLINS